MDNNGFRDKRIRILNSFYPEGPIPMNTNRKLDNAAEEIDEVVPPTGEGDGKKIRGVHQVGDERRLGLERRCFSYTVYVPERRSGRERRTNAGVSLPSYQQ